MSFDDSADAIRYAVYDNRCRYVFEEQDSYTYDEAEILIAKAATAYMALTGWQPTLLLINQKIMKPIREFAGAKEGDTVVTWTGYNVQETEEPGVTAIGPAR